MLCFPFSSVKMPTRSNRFHNSNWIKIIFYRCDFKHCRIGGRKSEGLNLSGDFFTRHGQWAAIASKWYIFHPSADVWITTRKNVWIITRKNRLRPMFSLITLNPEALVTDNGFYYVCFNCLNKINHVKL